MSTRSKPNSPALQQLLDSTCRAATIVFGVDHCGVVLFQPDGRRGTVVAEHPSLGVRGSVVVMAGVRREQALFRKRRPIVVNDLLHERHGLGEAASGLKAIDARSVLIVPIVVGKRVVGSFSLDVCSPSPRRKFSRIDVKRSTEFARLLAIAVKNASRSVDLSSVRRLSLEMLARATSKADVLRTIVRTATRLLNAHAGGVYEYDPEDDELELVERYPPRPDTLGVRLKPGEGLAGRLFVSSRSWMSVRDYDRYRGRAAVFSDRRLFAAVLEVKLVWQDRPLGVLFVDDKRGRVFTADDARLLHLFADYASIALGEADRRSRYEDLSRRLELLAGAASDFASSRQSRDPDELYSKVTLYASELFRAQSAGLFVARTVDEMELVSSTGDGDWSLEKGRTVRVQRDGGGLLGYAAASDEPVNLWGRELETLSKRARGDLPQEPGKTRRSFLSSPLWRRDGTTRLGLLTVEDCVARHVSTGRATRFSSVDRYLIQLFSQVVAAAIEDAQQMDHALADAALATEAMEPRGPAVAYVMHQVNGLLGNVELTLNDFCDWVETESSAPLRRRKELARLRQEAANIVAATSEFMTLVSNSRSGRSTTCSPNDVVSTAARLSAAGLESAGISISFELERGLPEVRGGKLHVVEVLCNLYRNAQVAMLSSTVKELRVQTSLAPDGAWVDIQVRDTGCGIPRQLHDRIFAQGFTTHSGRGGHGFGLAACRDLIENRYGGRLILGSSSVGKGSQFVLRLPLHSNTGRAR